MNVQDPCFAVLNLAVKLQLMILEELEPRELTTYMYEGASIRLASEL